MFDLLLRNGRIVDGTGQTWFRASLGITGDTLTVVRGDTSQVQAGRVIDVAGSVVCPGFIDMHSHSELKLMTEPEHQAKVRQGVTTEVIGMDGLSYAPISPAKEIGAGSVAKLVHNMIGHGVRQAIAEGMTLGVKAGVDTEALWQCIRRGSLGRMNALHEGFARTVFKGEYEPTSFALSLARKDIGLATELAKEYDVPMPVANLAEQLAIQAMNRGWGDMDSTVIVRLQEEMADVEIRADIDVAKAGRFITTHPDE